MTTPFTAKPTLGGGLVTLRPICADDVEWISPILREPDVNILTGSVHSSAGPFGEGCEPDALRPIYGRWAEADDRLVLAIVDNVTVRASARPCSTTGTPATGRADSAS